MLVECSPKMSYLSSARLSIRTLSSDWIRTCRCNVALSAARPGMVVQQQLVCILTHRVGGLIRHRQICPQMFQRCPFSSSMTINSNVDVDDLHKDQIKKRLIVLGKSATISCMTSHFLDIYPEIDALTAANLVSYVTKELLPFNVDLDLPSSENLSVRRAKMYTEIGKMMSEKGKEFTHNQIRNYIGGRYSKSEISTYSKLAHPAPLLKMIAVKLGMQLEVRRTGRSRVKVLIGDTVVKEASASTFEKAEYNACLAVIKEHFMNEVENVALEAGEEVLTREFKGKFDGQRVVHLSKAESDDTFGIYLKGGEKATKQTEQFWEFNFIEPIFINKILEGSPAYRSGCLQEGDVILAVGEFTLSGVTLKSAVSMINEESSNVTLTVQFDPEVKLRSKIKEEFITMENRAFKETLKSDRWGRWHEAQAETNPDKYLKVK